MKKIICILLTALLLFLTACQAEGEVQLFATTVGKGDALILKVNGWTGLIDTGKAYARGKVLSALKTMGVDSLDAVFLTHTDNDHAGGLEWLAASDFPVGAWYAPAMFTGVKEGKHPMVKAVRERDEDVRWLQRGNRIELPDGSSLDVLAPGQRFTDKDDNNSLVLMLNTSQGRMLLTGDMELPEEADLMSHGDDLSAAVLKVANHADDDTTSQAFANAVRPQVAIISTDSQEKPGTPDAGVLTRLQFAGATCYVTQDAQLGLLVTLQNGQARVDAVNIDAALPSGVTVQDAIPGEDLVILANSGADCDLTGWYLYSERGGELYAFPDGTTLRAGATLTVGTNSSDADFDLLWDDKKVIHKSKSDAIVLYDSYGRYVDSESNGM